MLIQIKNLSKKYQLDHIEVDALKNVHLNIRQNEYVAIMGPSGSGKSTLMNIIGCLDTPTSGEYLFNNVNVNGLDDNTLSAMRNKEIGFVFQNFNLLPRLNAVHNVEMPLVYAGVRKKERQARALKALERVGLADRIAHKPGELSGGQRQRVAIARALVSNPGILLADEPTGALDSKTGDEIMELFNKLHQEGNTIILITHEPAIADFAHRIVFIKDGTVHSDTPNPKEKQTNNTYKP